MHAILQFVTPCLVGLLAVCAVYAQSFAEQVAEFERATAAPAARAKDTCECDGDPTQCTCGTSCECSSVGGDCRLLTYWREPSTGVVYEYRGDTWTGVAIDAEGRWWKDGKLLHAALPWRGGAGAACGT